MDATDTLSPMLTRLKLTAIRDRLDTPLDEAGRRDLSLRERLAFLCEAEIARKDQRRGAMALSIAKFPALRTVEDYDFAALPLEMTAAKLIFSSCRAAMSAPPP